MFAKGPESVKGQCLDQCTLFCPGGNPFIRVRLSTIRVSNYPVQGITNQTITQVTHPTKFDPTRLKQKKSNLKMKITEAATADADTKRERYSGLVQTKIE